MSLSRSEEVNAEHRYFQVTSPLWQSAVSVSQRLKPVNSGFSPGLVWKNVTGRASTSTPRPSRRTLNASQASSRLKKSEKTEDSKVENVGGLLPHFMEGKEWWENLKRSIITSG